MRTECLELLGLETALVIAVKAAYFRARDSHAFLVNWSAD